ncbi:hypothetical protein BC834DRAFT_898651 [Gloeopeniophorella convolvens]|nr:hypothetical protein BC834DRAFT_898651 [Gloeopeniophorella convolvens]
MMRQFDATEDTLRRYISHGNSLLLANLLYFVRRSLFASPHSIGRTNLELVTENKSILMGDTLPELQQQFCKVWNGVVDLAKRQFGGSSESDYRRRTSLEVLAFMRRLFVSLHPELAFPFNLRITAPLDVVELPDTLPALPSCPDSTCHAARMQRHDTHDHQSHPSRRKCPSSSASNATSLPSDEGTTNAQATPSSQPATPSVSSPLTPRELPATLLIGPASLGSGAPVVDTSTPFHASDNAVRSSHLSSPIAPSTVPVQHAESFTTSLLHRSQDASGLARAPNPSPDTATGILSHPSA